MKTYLSDLFEVSAANIEEYGSFNISLLSDLPLFVDPFLLFNNPQTEYQDLHAEMI